MTQDDFAQRAAKWDQNPDRLAAAQAFLETVTPLAGTRLQGRVLDFGAGTGLIGIPLAARARHVDFVDSSAGMLEVLQAKLRDRSLTNATLHLGELDSLNLPQKGFDAIVTNNALHHVEDVESLVVRLAALLAPRGVLIIGDVAEEDGSFHAPNHVPHNGFRPDRLAEMLTRAGLRVAAVVLHHTIRKICHDGTAREFPQFLILSEKP